MYKTNIDTVTVHPFNDEVMVQCSYKDFAFYCIHTFETVNPSDKELANDFMINTRITPKNKQNFTSEQIQYAFMKMIERKKEDFNKNKDLY